MDEHNMKKKAEIENAKARLQDTKHMIAETVTRISKTEAEHQELKSQYNKKLKSFNSIQGTQCIKMSKLDNDLRVIEGMLQSRTDEEIAFQKTNARLKEELQNLHEETATMKVEFSSKLEALEESIKMGYMQLQNDKEAEDLLEVGLSSLTADEHLPFVENVLNRTLEAKRRREKDLKEELNALEEAQQRAKKNIQDKMDELAEMKKEYSSLIKAHKSMKTKGDSLLSC